MLQRGTLLNDGFDIEPVPNTLVTGLWSVSNYVNGPNVTEKINTLFDVHSNVCCVLPNVMIARLWQPGEFNTYYWRDGCEFLITVGSRRRSIKWKVIDNPITVSIVTTGTYVQIFDKNIGVIVQETDTYAWWPQSDGELTVMVNGIEISNEMIVTYNDQGEVFIDVCVSPLDINAVMLTLSDLRMWTTHDINGSSYESRQRFDISDPNMVLWQAYCKGNWLFDTGIQSWINSQTHWVRTISVAIRQVWNVTDVHVWRRRALKEHYGQLGTVIVDKRITGYFIHGSKRTYVAVSGHLLNLMLMFHLGVIDIRRHLSMIEGNLKVVTNRRSRS
jgi:hypothetical protein